MKYLMILVLTLVGCVTSPEPECRATSQVWSDSAKGWVDKPVPCKADSSRVDGLGTGNNNANKQGG